MTTCKLCNHPLPVPTRQDGRQREFCPGDLCRRIYYYRENPEFRAKVNCSRDLALFEAGDHSRLEQARSGVWLCSVCGEPFDHSDKERVGHRACIDARRQEYKNAYNEKKRKQRADAKADRPTYGIELPPAPPAPQTSRAGAGIGILGTKLTPAERELQTRLDAIANAARAGEPVTYVANLPEWKRRILANVDAAGHYGRPLTAAEKGTVVG